MTSVACSDTNNTFYYIQLTALLMSLIKFSVLPTRKSRWPHVTLLLRMVIPGTLVIGFYRLQVACYSPAHIHFCVARNLISDADSSPVK